MLELQDIVGQSQAIDRLMNNYTGGRMGHALLFAGPRGVGRRTTAAALAKLLLCHKPTTDLAGQTRPCNGCESCRLMNSQTHPDFQLVYKELARYHEDAAVRNRVMQDLGIDVIRSFLIDPAYRSAALAHGKVFVVQETDLMSIAAQNSLLKTLEEPPAGVTIILITDRPDQLLPTTRSRCGLFRFVSLPYDFVVSKLIERGLDEQEAGFWAAFTEGSLGLAIQFSEADFYDVKCTLINDLAELGGGNDAQVGEGWAKMTDKLADNAVKQAKKDDGASLSKNLATRQATGTMLKLLSSCFSDALTVSTQTQRPLVHSDQTQCVTALANKFSPAQIAEIIEHLSQYEKLLWRNVSPKTVWDNVVISCSTAAPLKL